MARHTGTGRRAATRLGALLIGILGAFVLLMAFRAVPAVTEYLAIERIVGVLAVEGDNGASATELRRSFDRRGEIDNISSVTGADLDIVKDENQTVIEIDYERTVPMVANVSLLIAFQVSSKAR